MNYYISDTHFLHENILHYCKRPFPDVDSMDTALVEAIRAVDADPDARIYHMGGLTFKLRAFIDKYGDLKYPENHTLIAGNHDRLKHRADVKLANEWFGKVIGNEKSWTTNSLQIHEGDIRILLSHLPQTDLQGADFNIFGHFHNNLLADDPHDPEWLWTLTSPVHLNASVEIVGYRPVTFKELCEANGK